MSDINADNAVKILKNLQNTNGNYLTDENGIKSEFKKDAGSSIFSQKNLYKMLNIDNDKEYKELLGNYDNNGDGILDANEAEHVAESLQNDEVSGSKKSALSKVVSFVVGAVTAQCASMTNLRKIDNNYSIFPTDTRGCLKNNNSNTSNSVLNLGEKALNSEAWNGTNDNYDYLQYNGNDPKDVSAAINNASSDGYITKDEINNNAVLTKLFKERNLTNNNDRDSYKNTSNGFNSAFYSIDSNGDGNISRNELSNFVNNKANDDVKKALGSIDTSPVTTNSVITNSSNPVNTVLTDYTTAPLPECSDPSDVELDLDDDEYMDLSTIPSTTYHGSTPDMGDWPFTTKMRKHPKHGSNPNVGEYPFDTNVPSNLYNESSLDFNDWWYLNELIIQANIIKTALYLLMLCFELYTSFKIFYTCF
jgi:Ca2+-binding EF-hand superfamily protein